MNFDDVLLWRGIDESAGDVPCRSCGGAGVRAYGSTATWQGGIGGQAITSGVCDKCWGSGIAERPWTDLRRIKARITELERERGELREKLADAQFDEDSVKHMAKQLNELRAELGKIECSRSHPHENMGPVCELKSKTAKVINEAAHLRAENEKLKGDIRCMVEKAAANSLDGYRELGQRAAEAENKADSLRAENERLLDVIDKACNALTDSICVSGNDRATNLHWVRKLKRAALAKGE